jgi:hypothetical protein
MAGRPPIHAARLTNDLTRGSPGDLPGWRGGPAMPSAGALLFPCHGHVGVPNLLDSPGLHRSALAAVQRPGNNQA